MVSDRNYFNTTHMVFTNSIVKEEVKKLAKEQKVNMSYIFDDAIRKLLKDAGKEIPEAPIRPNL